jgi:hypothetical protein
MTDRHELDPDEMENRRIRRRKSENGINIEGRKLDHVQSFGCAGIKRMNEMREPEAGSQRQQRAPHQRH